MQFSEKIDKIGFSHYSRVKMWIFGVKKSSEAHFLSKLNYDTLDFFFLKIVESFHKYCHDLP